jgi:hypothetical protein
MNKKEFIIPIVSIVVLVLIGVLLVVYSKNEQAPVNQQMASTTATSTATTSGTTISSGSGAPSYYPYGSVTLGINQAAGFQDGVSIRPVAVLEDSRCPIGVQCIQAGTVRVSLHTSAKNSATLTIEAGLNKPVTVGGDTVTLTAVTPVPTKDTIRPSDSAYRFTFTVKPHETAASAAPCYVGGCSAQLCTDKPDAISTCEYSPSYGCYKAATCERQASGQCGWTQTPALTACLANPPSAS